MTSSPVPEELVLVHGCGRRRSLTIHRAEGGAVVLAYGSELLLTPADLEANRDRHGNIALLRRLDDEGEQVTAWGEVLVRRGPFPPDEPRYLPGSLEEDRVRHQRREEAYRILDPQAREAALATLRKEMPRTTSRTLLAYERRSL